MLLELIKKYDEIIQAIEIEEFDSAGPHIRLKGKVVFQNKSILFFRQIILDELNFKYAYHWQNAEGNLICRWDNSPHWPDVVTHPHHKHIVLQDDEVVRESLGGGDLKYIFEEILELMSKNIL